MKSRPVLLNHVSAETGLPQIYFRGRGRGRLAGLEGRARRGGIGRATRIALFDPYESLTIALRLLNPPQLLGKSNGQE